ncbi:MAG: hypothetical protein ACPGJV_03550 [Bacteriovoracaceae bacterium]
MSAIHFYLTFNPYLNQGLEGDYTQAHEFNDFLTELLKKDSSSYAYWGKIIGKDRESTVDLKMFVKAISDNKEQSLSTHLYITDFTHLWVGKVTEVTDKISKNEMRKHSLDFYQDKKVEIWFKIEDFTLLEFQPGETANKLSELYIENNYVENKIQGLSPFTTSIRYPTFVQDLAEEQYFDEFDDSEQDHLILKGHHAINKTSASQVLRALHNYAFPGELYNKLPHAAKSEIESAELDILESRHFNMGRIAFSYLKALEIILNDCIIHHLKRCGYGEEFFVDASQNPPKIYLEKNNSDCVSISKFSKNFSIGQLIYFVGRCQNSSNFCFRKAFQNKKPFVQFITKELDKILKDNQLIEIRNLLAHEGQSAIEQDDAYSVRNIILGIGCYGLIHRIYQAFYNEEFKFLAKVGGKYSKKKEAA